MFLGLYTKTMVHRIWRFTLVKSKMVKPLDTAKDIYWRFGEPNKLSAILIEGLKFWRFGVKRWVNWVFERAVNCAC